MSSSKKISSESYKYAYMPGRASPNLVRVCNGLARKSSSRPRAGPSRSRPGLGQPVGQGFMVRAGAGKKARTKPGWPGPRANTILKSFSKLRFILPELGLKRVLKVLLNT